MAANDNENPFGLSPEEKRVLRYWQNGDNMTEAYKKVMLSEYDRRAISDLALKKRVSRFFGTYRLREAMAATPGDRGERAKRDFEKWKETQTAEQIRKLNEDKRPKKSKIEEENKLFEDEINRRASMGTLPRTDREKWLESLNVNENPTSMTIYGTGQFITYMAVKEIMDRQKEIKAKGISVLDKNGSVFTPTIISALKTAAAMVLPYAPAPTAEDRKEMSKAAVLLGLFPDQIEEAPDYYVAPPPATVDVEKEDD